MRAPFPFRSPPSSGAVPRHLHDKSAALSVRQGPSGKAPCAAKSALAELADALCNFRKLAPHPTPHEGGARN